MGVAEQEAVSLDVHLAHLPLNAVEQAQLVEMLQREHRRCVHLPVALARRFCLFEKRHDGLLGEVAQRLRRTLLRPTVGRAFVERLLHSARDDALVVLSVLQFDEVAGRPRLAVAKGGDVNAFRFESLEELRRNTFQFRFGFVAYGSDALGVLLEEALLVQQCVKLLALCLVELAEDVLAERLYVADDVPVLVVVDVLLYITENPLQQFVLFAQFVDHLVYGDALNLSVVKLDAQVGREVELACKVAQHALEERVDGLDAEVAVVVYNIKKSDLGAIGHKLFGHTKFALYLFYIILRLRELLPYTIKLTEDTCLHLLSSFVRKRNSECRTETHRVLDEQLYVFYG